MYIYKTYDIYVLLDSIGNSSSEECLPIKTFVFSFSPDESKDIEPQAVIYKCNEKSRPLRNTRTYFSLSKNTWIPIIAKHFWVHTLLPCCISFRRAKIYPTGSNYIFIMNVVQYVIHNLRE